MAAVCPNPYDSDEAAAVHHDLFQFNIFAYESFFLSDNGLMGGEITAVVAQHYAQRGFLPGASTTDADHLGCEVSFLAFLADAEADAWEDNLPQEAKRMQALQQTFFQTHLLRWCIPCLIAIQKQADPFFAQLAALTLSLFLTHYEELGKTAVSPANNFLPTVQISLTNDTTDFKAIVRHLITPAFSGIVLSRTNIGQLARHLQLPRGFGNREQMMLNLMRTAVQYENLPQLLQLLRETAVKWQTNYQTLSATYPKATHFIAPWQQRAQNSHYLLIQISDQA